MITDAMGYYLFFAGLGSIFVLRFYGGKYWYIFLILGLSLMSIRFLMDKVTILSGNKEKQEFLTFKSSHSYTFKNGSTKSILINDYTLINDSDETLIIEKVEYSRFSTTSSGGNLLSWISPYSSQILEYNIDYFYDDPPSSIRVKSGNITTRFWLHKY